MRPRYQPGLEGLEAKTLLAYVNPLDGFLTGPQAGTPMEIAARFLRARGSDWGLSGADVGRLIVSNAVTDTVTGTTLLYLRQGYNGLRVDNATLNVALSAKGEVILVGGGFNPTLGTKASAAQPPAPVLSASQALVAAASSLGLASAVPPAELKAATTVDRATVLSAPEFSRQEIPMRLEYIAMPDQSVRLAWQLDLDVPKGDHWWDMSIDARSGEVLQQVDWGHGVADGSSYNVYQLPLTDPLDGARTIVNEPADPVASPFGWHDTNGAAGAEFTITSGNNVIAYEDSDNDNQPGFQPDGGAGLDFNFPLDLNQDPDQYTAAAVTQLFYTNNILHDVLYRYGFDEVSGNFQVNNYGKGGDGNDPVRAEAQDGGGINNANFFTPPDGQSGRMQMYLGDLVSPMRDGSLDSMVVVHEFGHGISTRLTGGPADSSSLSLWQSAGMGEGWGDYLGLWFTMKSTDTANMARNMGEYLFPGFLPGGVRRQPYSYDMSIDTLTADNFNSIPPDTAYYNIGELWASALWDMTWNLIDRYGFDPNFHTGTGGNNLAMQIVVLAMKLQPSNPNVREARDAVLMADQALTGGTNQSAIWKAFARRGMGLDFDSGPVNSTTFIQSSYETPIFIEANFAAPSGLRENTTFNDVVFATFDDAEGVNAPGDYTANLSWGDGTAVTGGTIVMINPNRFEVRGSHQYVEGGKYTVKVTINKPVTGGIASAQGEAPISEIPMKEAFGTTIKLAEGALFDGLIATFDDSDDPDAMTAARYSVEIHWGDDDTVSAGQITQVGPNRFEVRASHVVGGGKNDVEVLVTGPGGNVTSILSHLDVTDSKLTADPGFELKEEVEGVPLTKPVARFEDADPRFPGPSNYFAKISWGDGNITDGTIVADSLGVFLVTGDHPYDVGTYNITINIGNFSGDVDDTVVVISKATVTPAPITASAFNFSVQEGQDLSGFLGVFTDTDPRAAENPTPEGFGEGRYSAVIDWGDGSAKEKGQIIVNHDGGFLVKPPDPDPPADQHRYRHAKDEPYEFTITITDLESGGGTTVTGNVSVSPAPVNVEVVAAVNPVEGESFDGRSVAVITTTNSLAKAEDFKATIDWGDGTFVANARILPNPLGPGFVVLADDKTYQDVGSFPVTVLVTSSAGTTTDSGRIDVDDAPLEATGAPGTIELTSKTPSGARVVATFIDTDKTPPTDFLAEYSATVDWGDGAGPVPATIEADPSGGYRVIGDHAYLRDGDFTAIVTVTSRFGASDTATTQTSVEALLFEITGRLDPSAGPNAALGVTQQAAPVLTGTSEPFARVSLFAQDPALAAPVLIGTGTSDASGVWQITISPLSEGSHTILASALDALGSPSSNQTQILPGGSSGPLVIDNTGPQVENVVVNARRGQVAVKFADKGSGFLASTLQDPNNFSLSIVGRRTNRQLPLSRIDVTATDEALLTFGGLKPLKNGKYVIEIQSKGLTDTAGNILDERFFVPFPGLYTRSGQNYIAQFTSNGQTTSALQQFVPPPEITAAKKFRDRLGRMRASQARR
jgi:extracellular elastinolytic metalloproteinase